jgi:hypothetical protein
MQISSLKINISKNPFIIKAKEMVLAKETKSIVVPSPGRRRLRRIFQKPLEEGRRAQVIDFPKKTPACEVYEKERRWALCGTDKVPAKEIFIREMERVLLCLAKKDPELGVVLLRADKKSLNALNKTGGKHGAGDSCLSLYMDALEQSVRSTYPFAKRTYLVRDSTSSDETFIVIAGNQEMLQKSSSQFSQIQEKTISQNMEQLDQYKYSENKLIEGLGIQKVQGINLDLAKFSNALRTPELVAQAHITGPKLIPNDEFGPGFISRALGELGKKEIVKSSLLPPSFSPIFINKPGISPYIDELPVSGFLCSKAVALEMKFTHTNESDKWAAFDFLDKTGKGVAEILSGRFGLRYINTFMGESTADHIIQATALAMKDLELEMKCRIMPTDSKLMYVVEGMDTETLILKIQELVKIRMGPVMGSHTISFKPSPRAILAADMHANDLRAHMALDAMQLDHPTQALTYLDLMVSAAKELRPEILSMAINQSRLNPQFTIEASNAFSTMCGLLYQNPAIRDAEDLIYSIRSGMMVVQKGAEEKIWEFAKNWGIELRNRLLEVFEKL